MNYAKIKHFDVAIGDGVRVSIFVSGCKFHCKDCFNSETWDYNYGNQYTQETEDELINLISNPNIDGLSILGGDPLWQDESGLQTLINLVNKVHSMNKTVWIWSGFTWEQIFPGIVTDDFDITRVLKQELISHCDVFVDGRFEVDKRNLKLKWRGSSNQRIIDVKKTLEQHKINLLED